MTYDTKYPWYSLGFGWMTRTDDVGDKGLHTICVKIYHLSSHSQSQFWWHLKYLGLPGCLKHSYVLLRDDAQKGGSPFLYIEETDEVLLYYNEIKTILELWKNNV